MRRFLLVAHDARTSPDFSLDDLPGSGGRMDLVARCAAASLHVSHDVRADSEFVALLQGPSNPPRTIRIAGAEVRGMNPDERSTAALIQKALREKGIAERQAHPGVYTSGQSLGDLILRWREPIILLLEGAPDIRSSPVPKDATFVLSDHHVLSLEETRTVSDAARLLLSVGPRALQSDQVIAIVHNELDRRG